MTPTYKGKSRVLLERADVQKFLTAGYSEKNILGVILAIGVKTLSNYTNRVFQTTVDGVFASRAWKAA